MYEYLMIQISPLIEIERMVLHIRLITSNEFESQT